MLPADSAYKWTAPPANNYIDEAVFANADAFRIDRRPNPHLAFGLGRHHCIGAHMARLEMRALLKALLPRLDQAELAAPPRRTSSTMVSGISSLPIRCVS